MSEFKMVEVLEVDQFGSSKEVIEQFVLEDFRTGRINKKNTKGLGIEDPRITKVPDAEDSLPYLGWLWFKPGPDGYLKIWRTNYDTSG